MTLNDAIASTNSTLAATTSKADNAQARLNPTYAENLKYTTRGSGCRAVYWNTSSVNVPAANTWGVCFQLDYYVDGGNKWYNNLAFSTDGRIFVSSKRNDDTWSPWKQVTTTAL